MGILSGEEKRKGKERLFKEIMDENFPNLGKEIGIQIHDAQRIPNRLNPKKVTC